MGLGGPLRQACNKPITKAHALGGVPLAVAAFLALAPLAARFKHTGASLQPVRPGPKTLVVMKPVLVVCE
jgi:hypothetical protein